jgi:hypothetical protein
MILIVNRSSEKIVDSTATEHEEHQRESGKWSKYVTEEL